MSMLAMLTRRFELKIKLEVALKRPWAIIQAIVI